jgi:DNA-binding MarR family transcriptional regulator
MFSVQVKVTQFQRKLIPWEKNNLQAFENKMLRKLSGYKKDAVRRQLG